MKNVIDAIATEFELSKKVAKAVVDSVVNAIGNEIVTTGGLSISGFGKFTVKTRAARNGINPKTKEPIKIAESKAVGFKASKNLKEAVQ